MLMSVLKPHGDPDGCVYFKIGAFPGPLRLKPECTLWKNATVSIFPGSAGVFISFTDTAGTCWPKGDEEGSPKQENHTSSPNRLSPGGGMKRRTHRQTCCSLMCQQHLTGFVFVHPQVFAIQLHLLFIAPCLWVEPAVSPQLCCCQPACSPAARPPLRLQQYDDPDSVASVWAVCSCYSPALSCHLCGR